MEKLTGLMRIKALTVASAGAGATSISLRPDAGIIIKVIYAWFYHAAGAARNSAWYWTDPDTPAGVPISGTIALAASTPLVFGALAALGADGVGYPVNYEAPWATQYSFPTALWTAAGAGENGYLYALVMEQSGVSKVG